MKRKVNTYYFWNQDGEGCIARGKTRKQAWEIVKWGMLHDGGILVRAYKKKEGAGKK